MSKLKKILASIRNWYRENEKLYEVYISGPYGSCTKTGWGCNLLLTKPEIKEWEESGSYKCTILGEED